ncbi:hypothetical protein Skr01_22080 [Sphaerisporangium krabiense]|uniref:Peptidyl-tRNA hydrolase n=1 Tax=Sphaerisporangium krabiense TaxID=763782 RepID=A0A7W8Z5Q6_9ACTN|nr:SbcC/MukB-like Walker B domain-containing protein [Sphaerisporangium krabiense]MBB5627961.1 peptidyl-tRNA hydrolase [Sphaerisporangium krabiense]GII62123.1 hypothetical protein Skr01_22080 [Sphaerisporangium krabiense]
MTDRFKPARAGVINVWDYVDEEFVFADGRLVLRGHNGSGKTKALEVLFPFILDGVADARRLDPFSGENRTMKSNLLYRGQEAEYGYVWMEFARVPGGTREPAESTGGNAGSSGTAETVTLIIGLRAHRNRDGVRSSFFVTGRRLGVDFGLLAPDGRPLTENQLKAILEPGAFSATATEYRAAVDARLFGLGRERYGQLLDLLLALRRPLLAKDLDPGKVSDTLTSGLSPVDDVLVDQAARDFENLAAVQRQFDDFTIADTAVRAFLADYTEYLRTHATYRLGRITAASGVAVEHARAVALAAAELRRAGGAHERAARARELAETERQGLEAREAALRAHDAYRAQSRLELQRRQIARGRDEIAAERRRLSGVADDLEELAREAGEIADRLERATVTTARLSTELTEVAERAGIAFDGDGAADTGDDLPITAKARAAARRDDVAEARHRLRLAADADLRRRRADEELADAATAVTDGEVQCAEAETRLGEARAATREALRRWADQWPDGRTAGPSAATAADDAGTIAAPLEDGSGTAVVRDGVAIWTVAGPGDVEALSEAVERLGEPGAPTLLEIFAARTDGRRLECAGHVERLRAQIVGLDAELERLSGERAEIEAERDDAPPSGDLRTAEREGRPGAPLWRLARFAEPVEARRAAGVEGALYGAGMLTAWVHPDPDLTAAAVLAAESDGYLVPLPPEHRPDGPTLADVLVPDDQDLVPAEVITAVLRSVALTDELTGLPAGVAPVVTAGAQFGHGVLVGARPKRAPEYIGATNRANRRRERLAEYDALIAGHRKEREVTAGELARAGAALEDFRRARDTLPAIEPISGAVRSLAHQSTLLAAARTTWERRRKALDSAVAEVDAQRRRLRQVAAERGTPTEADAIDAVARAVDDFERVANALHAERGQAVTIERDLAARQASVARQRERHATETTALQAKENEHNAAVAELAAYEEALDAPLKEVIAQLDEVERLLKEVRARESEAVVEVSREHDAVIRAENDLKHGSTSLAESFAHLFEHTTSFAPYAHGDLRPMLGVSATTPWPADADRFDPISAAESVVTTLARTPAAAPPPSGDSPEAGAGRVDEVVWAALPGGVAGLLDEFRGALGGGRAVSESALKQASSRMSAALRVFQEALDSCGEDYRLDHDPGAAGVVMVYVNDEGGRNPVAAFARRIADRVGEQGVLLEERERTVLENELLAGLAQQIHDRVLAARDLVVGMNDDLRSRRMSSGTGIGIRWSRSDKITDRQRAAARLLERDAQGLGPAGLAELRALLREMIRDYRAAHPRATYRQALAEVLDYRVWYTFELRLVVPGEEEVRLTKAKHEQMSGGEKSAAIHLPLFAAANALYSSAKPTCPRTIALDEAFAGIDDRYKPELLGLTVTFDLDLFMTGHDLWVHFDTVPMAAHYDMHHDKGAHTVSAMLMVWDGTHTIDADAAFSGNDDLATTLLGIRPSRLTPTSADNPLLAALESLSVPDSPDDEDHVRGGDV